MQTEGKVITHSLPFDMGHARSFYSEKALDLSESNSPRRRSWWDVLSKSQPRESLRSRWCYKPDLGQGVHNQGSAPPRLEASHGALLISPELSRSCSQGLRPLTGRCQQFDLPWQDIPKPIVEQSGCQGLQLGGPCELPCPGETPCVLSRHLVV